MIQGRQKLVRSILPVLGLILLSACGSGDSTGTNNAAADPVAGASAPEGKQWTDIVEQTPEGGYRMGNPNAPIKLVEFGSRTCSHCAEFTETAMSPLTSQYVASGKVSYEYRDFLRNGADIAAALIGQCGGAATFFPLLETMFREQDATMQKLQALPESFYREMERLTPDAQTVRFGDAAGYIELAKRSGIPEAKARACLSDTSQAQALIEANKKAGDRYAIPGTPAFLINGELVEDAAAWDKLEPALKAAGA